MMRMNYYDYMIMYVRLDMMMTINLLTSLYIEYVYSYLTYIITFIDRTYIYNDLIMIFK